MVGGGWDRFKMIGRVVWRLWKGFWPNKYWKNKKWKIYLRILHWMKIMYLCVIWCPGWSLDEDLDIPEKIKKCHFSKNDVLETSNFEFLKFVSFRFAKLRAIVASWNNYLENTIINYSSRVHRIANRTGYGILCC